MNVFEITGLAIVAAAIAALLKRHSPEITLLLSVMAGALILVMLFSSGMPVFEKVREMFAVTGAQGEAVQILFKALGICFVVQIACDACRDMGETSMASKVELAGKISVLLLSLPLFDRILIIVQQLMGGS